MYKSILILAITFGSMAFLQSGKSNSISTNENHLNNNLLSFASPDQGGKGNKGGGGNHGNQAGSSKHNSQGAHGNDNANRNGNGSGNWNGNGNGNGNWKIKQQPQSNKYKNNQFDNDHPNFLYVYDNKHGYISHKNYGQWRSEQARNKHNNFRPVYEYEAVEGFNLIIARNVFLHTETEYKIDLYRNRLSVKRKLGTITVTEYDNSIRRVAILEQRRAALQINITL